MRCIYCVVIILLVSSALSQDSTEEAPVLNDANCGENLYGKIAKRPCEARLFEQPWLARFGYEQNNVVQYIYQGALIHPMYVLTSVFIVEYKSRGKLSHVRLGEYNTWTERDCQKTTDVAEECATAPQDILIDVIIKHPQYDTPAYANDLALVKLRRAADVSVSSVRPICVADESTPLSEHSALYFGAWCGSVQSGLSLVPRQYAVRYIGTQDCARRLSDFIDLDITTNQFCVVLDMVANAGNDCGDIHLRGTSGAPTFVADRNKIHLVGLLSIGVQNNLDTPLVLSNISAMHGWIRETITTDLENIRLSIAE